MSMRRYERSGRAVYPLAFAALLLLALESPLTQVRASASDEPAKTPAATTAPASAPSTGPAAERAKQWWKGRITIPTMPLDILVVFTPAESDAWSATIDIPMQGASKLPLTDVAVSADALAFTLPPPANAVFKLDRAADGTSASGTMVQHGMTFPVSMERVSEREAGSVGPERPQTPKPPFPYATREVTYRNESADITLAGTLSVPEGKGPHPVVLMITGSGPQDRDETLFGHKPFAVIADHLARRGIASLRVDDRGVGGSTGSTPKSTSEDFASDVRAGIAFLQQQPEIDRRRIALLGHSEGAMVAPMVAADSPDVAAVVLLAPPGKTGQEILKSQLAAILTAAGLPADKVESQVKTQQKLISQVVADASPAEIRKSIEELIRGEQEASGSAAPLDADAMKALVDAQYEQMNTPWMQFFILHDPREALRKVRQPVLALFGEKDLQVLPGENLMEVRQALESSGNTRVTVKALPKLNHLFQEAQTGLVMEYATLSQTIAPAALDEITSWLRTTLGVSD